MYTLRMASISETYREKRITIITSPNSATAQFEHNGRVYQQKLTNLKQTGNDKGCVQYLFMSACKQIDRVLGSTRAEHLLKT